MCARGLLGSLLSWNGMGRGKRARVGPWVPLGDPELKGPLLAVSGWGTGAGLCDSAQTRHGALGQAASLGGGHLQGKTQPRSVTCGGGCGNEFLSPGRGSGQHTMVAPILLLVQLCQAHQFPVTWQQQSSLQGPEPSPRSEAGLPGVLSSP